MAKEKTPIQRLHDEIITRWVNGFRYAPLMKGREEREGWERRGLTLAERDQSISRLMKEEKVEVFIYRGGLCICRGGFYVDEEGRFRAREGGSVAGPSSPADEETPRG